MSADLFTSCPWAITPEGLDPLFRVLEDSARAESVPAARAASAVSSGEDENHEWLYAVERGVAVIQVSGFMRKASGSFLWMFWEGLDRIRMAFDAAMANPSVRAVLLSFDSPGGVVGGVKELADHIAASHAKPVYAYADGQCHSAAYWLASATGKMYAPVTASVGSIGVLYVHTDRSRANAEQGLSLTYITAGASKALGNPDSPLSCEAMSFLQRYLATLHSIFRADVAARMGVDPDAPQAWGDGQVFLASEALALGLVTGLVTDRAALIDLIIKENSMDLKTLAEAHPELLAQIKSEAAKEGAAATSTAVRDAVAAAAETYVGLIHAVAGKDVADKVEMLAKTNATPEQVAAFVEVLGASHAPGKDAKPDPRPAPDPAAAEQPGAPKRRDILAALRGATPGPVDTSGAVGKPDEAQAAIDRISAL